MAVNNGYITAPVDVSDIRSAIGDGSTDIGTLCCSDKVNKWAKYKPMMLWRVNNTQPRMMLNDTLNASKQVTAAGTDRTYNRFGLKVPYSGDMPSSLPAAGKGALGKLFVYMADDYTGYDAFDWVHQKPSGGSAQPYRETDFNGYNHYAGPINTDSNLSESGDYVGPSDLPKTMMNSITDQSVVVGLAGPTQVNAITWYDLLTAIDSSDGEWRMTAEVYAADQPASGTEAKALCIKDLSGNWRVPTVFKATSAITSSMNYDQMTVTVPLGGFASTIKHINIIYGFVKYSSSGTPGNAILPPFWPIKRLFVDGNFPFNMRWTGVGYASGNNFSGFLSSSSTTVKNGITTASADLYFKFTVTVKSSSGLTLKNSNLSASGFGQYGEKVATSCKLCTSANAGATFPSEYGANDTLTLAANATTDVYVKCVGILQVGEQSTFVVRYTDSSGNTTEMATAYVKVTKSS